MDIRSLKMYLHLCDSLHFAKTAEQSHVSPSTLSRALQRLEDEVGSKLFDRDNRSVTITHAGVEFKRFAEQTLSEWTQLRSRIDPSQQFLRGNLNCVIAPTIQCQVQQWVSQAKIDWAKLPYIVPDHGPGRKRIDLWFKQMGIKPNIYAQVSGQEAIVSMVALGCGVGISPEAVIHNSPVRDRIQTLASPIPIPPFELGCCCKEKRTNDPIIRAFLDII